MTDSEDAVDRFAETLSAAGWEMTSGASWREDAAHGISVEAVLERPLGMLFVTFLPGRHVAVGVMDEEAREVVEFGFDFAGADDLEGALREIVAVQDTLVPSTLPPLLRALLDGGRRMSWEVQEQEEEEITPENVESSFYRRPLH